MKIKPVLVLVLLLISSPALLAQTTPPPEAPKPQSSPNLFEGYATIGGLGMDNSDYRGRVSEFTTANQGGRGAVGLSLWGNHGKFHYDFRGAYFGDERDQSHSMYFDVNRYWRTEIRYTRLPHRLDHDPLDVLDAGKGTIIVRSDDADASRLYEIIHGQLEVDSRFVIPKLKGVEFRFGYRDERRDGHTQARTMSKCANCHISAVTREVAQVTRDFTTGVRANIKRLSVEYTYLNRSFQERGATPLNTYDRAMQPQTTARIFDNRVSYDVDDGPLPFNHIPDVRRESHSLRARLELPKSTALNLNFVKSVAENEETGLGVDSMLWSARASIPFGRKAVLTARFRQMQVEGDSIFVDVAEQTAISGPQLGLTFAQSYPTFGSADYTRFSSDSRRPTTADLDFSYRLAARTTVKLGYQWEQVKRDHATDYSSVYETTRNTLRAGFNTRTADRKWLFRARYTYDHIDDPFALLRAAYMPVIQPFPSPGTPPSPLLGTQYYTLYRAREANLTNQPSRSHWVEESFTWSPSAKFSLSSHFRVKKQSNDQLNRSDWNHTSLTPGADVWVAVHPRFSFSAGYSYFRDRGDTWFVLPVFDG
jgi:opacity protein-like surface antigen